MLALYTVAAWAPQGVISIFGGTLADRMNRRVLIIATDATIAVTTLVLAFVLATGVMELWIILLAVALRSAGAGFQTPAVTAMIPQLTPPDQLMRVNGIFGTVQSGMGLLAPAVAAILYAVVGLMGTFFIDVATAVLGIGLLALIRVPTLVRDGGGSTSYAKDLADGFRYVTSNRLIRWLLGVFTIVFTLVVAPVAMTPLLVVREFGGESWKLAALESLFAGGTILGGVIFSIALASKNRIALIAASATSFGLLTTAMGLAPNLMVLLGCMFALGLLVPMFSAPFMTSFQLSSTPTMHGRVMSYVGIVMALATPTGMLVLSPLADVFSVNAVLVASGGLTVGTLAVAIALPSGRAVWRASRAGSADNPPENDQSERSSPELSR